MSVTLLATGVTRAALPGHRGGTRAVAFSPDGNTLATGGTDSTVRLWHVTTGEELLAFRDLPDQVNALDFSPDGKALGAAFPSGDIILWASR